MSTFRKTRPLLAVEGLMRQGRRVEAEDVAKRRLRDIDNTRLGRERKTMLQLLDEMRDR